ncbi:hypothetical protein BCR34DRAFT_284661 [Clohesyomyces aquaticus]|uniref:Uncharacterized protein n=1 Tax=Clohesyomyces aquaticus TaxID=1231657 RepID=A0A1Y1ZRE1_9PLEO|nr:hypothetical protein BCR34DRAFT_284661 [Clohesyomyces aquaticus]
MNSSTRLYERLEQIPQDPSDPESLEELVVCAFGAFERYYVCWRNRGGEYKQGINTSPITHSSLTKFVDGYDLPPSLHEWLFPSEGSSRDFPSLQVVFGRGDEYFASDKNGKLENKEPEIKKPVPRSESPEKLDKPILRRSRTLSFIRPPSDPAAKSFIPALDAHPHRETLSRPPSMTINPQYSITSAPQPPSSRPSSIATPTNSQPSSRPLSVSSARALSEPSSNPYSPVLDTPIKESPTMSPTPRQSQTQSRRPLSMSFNPSAFPRIIEEDKFRSPDARKRDSGHCTCGCHIPSQVQPPRPIYADASMQTDPSPPPSPERKRRPPKSLRVDITSDASTSSSASSASAQSSIYDIETPMTEILPAPNPVMMGRMLSYFNNPGYRLGDSLSSSLVYVQYQPMEVYQEKWSSPSMGRRQTV